MYQFDSIGPDARACAYDMTRFEAAFLRTWDADGAVLLPGAVPPALAGRLAAELDAAWQEERPSTVRWAQWFAAASRSSAARRRPALSGKDGAGRRAAAASRGRRANSSAQAARPPG